MTELQQQFGKFGERPDELCRGNADDCQLGLFGTEAAVASEAMRD